jgi:hypothetical protein
MRPTRNCRRSAGRSTTATTPRPCTPTHRPTTARIATNTPSDHKLVSRELDVALNRRETPPPTSGGRRASRCPGAAASRGRRSGDRAAERQHAAEATVRLETREAPRFSSAARVSQAHGCGEPDSRSRVEPAMSTSNTALSPCPEGSFFVPVRTEAAYRNGGSRLRPSAKRAAVWRSPMATTTLAAPSHSVVVWTPETVRSLEIPTAATCHAGFTRQRPGPAPATHEE